jgi:hypothetical protein
MDRTWYLMSDSPNRDRDSAIVFEVERHFEAEALATAGTYRYLRARGLMSRAQAWRQQSHEIWCQIGPGLGLRYDRVEGEPRLRDNEQT